MAAATRGQTPVVLDRDWAARLAPCAEHQVATRSTEAGWSAGVLHSPRLRQVLRARARARANEPALCRRPHVCVSRVEGGTGSEGGDTRRAGDHRQTLCGTVHTLVDRPPAA